MEKGGVTYWLSKINWSGGGENIPSASFDATVLYTGVAHGEKPDGYTVTATYSGDVTKEEPGNIQYTLIYEPVPEPVVVEPESKVNWSNILWLVLGGVGIGGLVFLAVFLFRKFGLFKRKKRPVYDDGYEPEARPARRKPHALGYMKRDGGMDNV